MDVANVVRYAPSACNSQPWRVFCGSGLIEIYRSTQVRSMIPENKRPYYNSIDMVAGHPILGAGSAIHEKLYSEENSITILFELNNRTLQSKSLKTENHYQAVMNQGVPEFMGAVEGKRKIPYIQALNLTAENLHPAFPMEVVSTGLPYLIVPLVSGLEQAGISIDDFELQLNNCNAKFVYVFDVNRMEGRTWDNLGAVEDVATGSAAGPIGAYLYKWNVCNSAESIMINQGGFVGRPSKIKVFADQNSGEISVTGDVKIIVKGTLLL